MGQINVAIIDQDNVDRDKYKSFCFQSYGLNCVMAVRSLERFMAYQKISQQLDILLFDIETADNSKHHFSKQIAKLKSILPDAQLIVFTRIKAEDQVIKAFHSGANGFLLKDQNRKKFESYLLSTQQNGAAISPQIARILIQRFNQEKMRTDDKWDELSRRQLEIVDLLTEGWSVQKIANHLNLTVNGVQYHIRIIYKQLNVRNKSELLKKSLTKKLI